MVKIKKEFLNNYDILQLNTNAKTFNEIAMKDSEGYIFTPLPSSGNEDLITSILRKSKDVNHSLLNSWEDKPWADDEIYNTANSYLTNQFESSKLSIKNEIPITGEDSAKMRFSLLLNTYLPVLVAHLTLHYKYPGGYDTFIKALTWDNDTIFLPLPVNKNGLIIWDDIFDKNEENEEIEQAPVTYDTTAIEELLENMYEKLCEKINHKVDEMKDFINHTYKMIPLSSTEFNKDMGELITDGGTEAINEKIDDLNTEVDTIIKEQESDDIDMLKQEIEMLTDANNRFKDKVKTLKNQIDIIDKENIRLIKRDSEVESEIVDLKNKISELEEQLENSTKSEIGNLDEESSAIIGVKDNEIAELKQELETRKENERLLRDRNAELEEGDNTLRKELNKVNEDNVNLNRELSTLQTEISNYIDTNRELERANEKLTASNKDLEKNIKDLEKELASIKKERGIDELEKIKEDNRILRQALEDLKHKKDNEKYIAKDSPKEVVDNPVSDKDPEVIAREKANRDRIGRMIYGDAYDGTQTF